MGSRERMKDKEVVMAAVQQTGRALDYAANNVKEELEKEAGSLDMRVQEYCAVALHPTVIQLFASKGSGSCLTINCLDIGGEEVLSFPLNTDADNAEKLCGELAMAKGVSPAALRIINHRG